MVIGNGKWLLVSIGRLLAHPSLWHFLLHRLTRYCVAWFVTSFAAGMALFEAWKAFDAPARNDGNYGHCTIDFGGQYLMGRMLRLGYGHHLFHRRYQRQVLSEIYPRQDQDPSQASSDVETLMGCMMGSDDAEAGKTLASFAAPLAAPNSLCLLPFLASGKVEWTSDKLDRILAERVGGPLYPPINCFTHYPLAFFPARDAYRINQVMNLVLALAAGLGVRILSQGRIWWPVAATVIIAFPGYSGSISLGQNATLTLCILIWGWVLMARSVPIWGGAVWGFLAFKPVWALSFFLTMVLTRRWRDAAAMILVGVALGALTLPFVGMESWLDWFRVGQEAAATYKADDNWIHLSRDLLSIPRRWLDFDPAEYYNRRDDIPTTIVGWALVIFVLEATLRLAFGRRIQIRAVTGPIPAFVLFAAWLCCFHFMYYDLLLAALPVFLLFTEPRQYLVPFFFTLAAVSRDQLGEKRAGYYRPGFSACYPPAPPPLPAGFQNIWVVNRVIPSLFAVLLGTAYVPYLLGFGLREFPWDTICVMAFWFWCAWLAVRIPDPLSSKQANDHERMEEAERAASWRDAPQVV